MKQYPEIYFKEVEELFDIDDDEPYPESVEEEYVDNRPDCSATVDDDIGFISEKLLSIHDVRYLLRQGYKRSRLTNMWTGRKEYFLLKPRYNESLMHFFTTMEIYYYLQKHTKRVKLYQAVKPDILLKMHKKTIAIEIETGKNLVNHRRRLLEKVKRLNEEYDEWFFVVTNKNFQSRYLQLGPCYNRLTIINKLNKVLENRPDNKTVHRYERTANLEV